MEKENKKLNLSKRMKIVIPAVVLVAIVAGIIVYNNSSAGQLRKQLQLGKRYLKELDYEQAVAVFKDILSIEPDNADALENIQTAYVEWGHVLRDSSQFESSISVFNESEEFFSEPQTILEEKVDTYEAWSDAYMNESQYEEALELLEKTVEPDVAKNEKIVDKTDKIRKEYIVQLIGGDEYPEAIEQIKRWIIDSHPDKQDIFDDAVEKYIDNMQKDDNYSGIIGFLQNMLKYIENNGDKINTDFVKDEKSRLTALYEKYSDEYEEYKKQEARNNNIEKFNKFKKDHSDQGRDFIAIVQTIRAVQKIPYERNPFIWIESKKKHLNAEDKSKGNIEFVCEGYDICSGTTHGIEYYSADLDDKTIKLIKKERWDYSLNIYSANIIEEEVAGEAVSYRDRYDSDTAEQMYKDIIDRFTSEVKEAKDFDIDSDKIWAYTEDMYIDRWIDDSRIGDMIWTIAVLDDGSYYAFSYMYDSDTGKTYGSCKESRPLDKNNKLYAVDEYIH